MPLVNGRHIGFLPFVPNEFCFTGTTTFGHDFDALSDINSPFVRKYNQVMDGIASPLCVYILFHQPNN